MNIANKPPTDTARGASWVNPQAPHIGGNTRADTQKYFGRHTITQGKNNIRALENSKNTQHPSLSVRPAPNQALGQRKVQLAADAHNQANVNWKNSTLKSARMKPRQAALLSLHKSLRPEEQRSLKIEQAGLKIFLQRKLLDLRTIVPKIIAEHKDLNEKRVGDLKKTIDGHTFPSIMAFATKTHIPSSENNKKQDQGFIRNPLQGITQFVKGTRPRDLPKSNSKTTVTPPVEERIQDSKPIQAVIGQVEAMASVVPEEYAGKLKSWVKATKDELAAMDNSGYTQLLKGDRSFVDDFCKSVQETADKYFQLLNECERVSGAPLPSDQAIGNQAFHDLLNDKNLSEKQKGVLSQELGAFKHKEASLDGRDSLQQYEAFVQHLNQPPPLAPELVNPLGQCLANNTFKNATIQLMQNYQSQISAASDQLTSALHDARDARYPGIQNTLNEWYQAQVLPVLSHNTLSVQDINGLKKKVITYKMEYKEGKSDTLSPLPEIGPKNYNEKYRNVLSRNIQATLKDLDPKIQNDLTQAILEEFARFSSRVDNKPSFNIYSMQEFFIHLEEQYKTSTRS